MLPSQQPPDIFRCPGKAVVGGHSDHHGPPVPQVGFGPQKGRGIKNAVGHFAHGSAGHGVMGEGVALLVCADSQQLAAAARDNEALLLEMLEMILELVP